MTEEVKPRSARWKTVLLVLVTAAIVVAILEVGARFAVRRQAQQQQSAQQTQVPLKAHDMSALDRVHINGPGICWRVKPDLKDYEIVGRCWNRDVRFVLSTNDHGLRNPPLAPEGTRTRILALGDSTTFGLGVANDETWPAQLEKRLNEEAGKPQFEVLNAGVPGMSLFQGLVYLDKIGFDYKPAVIVACFGHNDFDSWFSKTDIERAAEVEDIEKAPNKSASDLFVLAKRALNQAVNVADRALGAKTPRLTPEEFHDTLIEMKKLCDAKHVPVVFMRWPQEPQVLSRNSRPVHYEPVLINTCQEIGAPLVDLYVAFVNATGPLYLDPIHANANGCRVVAGAVEPEVKRLLGLQ